MKLKLIGSSILFGLLIAITSGYPLKSQAQSLVPADILFRSNFLDVDGEDEFESSDLSPLVYNWRKLSLLHTLDKHRSPIFGLAFNPRGNVLVSAGSRNDPLMRVWSVKNGKQIHSDRAHSTAVMDIAYSPDGSTLISAGQTSAINLWNGYNYKYESTFLLHANNVLALAVTPDGSTLVSGGLDGIQVINLQYRRPSFILAGVGNPSSALSIHPNGFIVASGNWNGKVSLWNLRTAELISEFNPHDKEINDVHFTPDGRKLITSSAERTIKIWDLITGELVQEFVGHRDRIRATALSSDGRTLASGGNDGVRIWDIETGELVVLIPSSNDWVESLAFSPDGSLLAVGSFNSKITIWQAKIGTE